MKLIKTKIQDLMIVDIEPLQDERGFFARTVCAKEFAQHGLKSEFVQCSVSYNSQKGILRGMHYQIQPNEEAKLVRCTRGAIYDVIIDLRRQSPTFCQWVAQELTAENHRAMYVPEGCAHGFMTLTADTEIFYQISAFYDPQSARGVRFNDPAFGIKWPDGVKSVMSDKDLNYPDFSS